MPCLPGPCVVAECAHVGQIIGRGMCTKHYQRWRVHGDVHHLERNRGDRVAGFWLHVAKGEDCWEWTACRNRKGYGQYWDGSTVVPAQRFVYQLMVGPIPKGLDIDHLCNNKGCVNPAHLEPVDKVENNRRRDIRMGRRSA